MLIKMSIDGMNSLTDFTLTARRKGERDLCLI
jgi:hypothetical protein